MEYDKSLEMKFHLLKENISTEKMVIKVRTDDYLQDSHTTASYVSS